MKNPPLGSILLVMTLAHTVTSFCNLSIPPLTPFLRDELHLTHAQVGMLVSFFYIGVVSASILFGWISDLLGERRALILGLGVQGLFMLCFAWTDTFLLGGLFLILAGIGYSSVNPATTKGVMRWFPPQGRATAMGVKQTGIPLGGILAASTLPGLAVACGWRTAIILVGVLTLIFVFIVRIGIPLAPSLQDQRSAMRWGQLREVFSNRGILALSFMGIFLAGTQLSIVTHLVLFLKSKFLFSSVLAGIFLAVAQVGGTTGRIGWGLVSDFLARGRRKEILVLIGIIAVAQLFLLSRIEPGISESLLLLMIGLLGCTTIGFHGVFIGFMGELAQRDLVGLTVGVSLTIQFMGIILFPPLFGYIVDRLGAYGRAWDMLALSWIVALFILIFLVKEKKLELKHQNPSTK
ncbi:MAG: MFS transporter [Deltaproteobacteria bacterium]|nr:MFS transporter [Deltaproteobacteria bacterium]